MNDFPKGGDVAATRAWLDSKGFKDLFVGWEADALLGKDDEYILNKLSGEKGEILCGLLNTARQQSAGKSSPPIQYQQPSCLYLILMLYR